MSAQFHLFCNQISFWRNIKLLWQSRPNGFTRNIRRWAHAKPPKQELLWNVSMTRRSGKIQFESRNSIRITLQNSVRAIFGLVVETKATAKRFEWKLFSESNKSLLKHEILPSKINFLSMMIRREQEPGFLKTSLERVKVMRSDNKTNTKLEEVRKLRLIFANSSQKRFPRTGFLHCAGVMMLEKFTLQSRSLRQRWLHWV